jgi:hypothetical protein
MTHQALRSPLPRNAARPARFGAAGTSAGLGEASGRAAGIAKRTNACFGGRRPAHRAGKWVRGESHQHLSVCPLVEPLDDTLDIDCNSLLAADPLVFVGTGKSTNRIDGKRETRIARMVARKAFHDLGFKMGDGVIAFWKFAHRTEPVVVYSVALGFLGASSAPLLQCARPRPPPHGAPAVLLPLETPGVPGTADGPSAPSSEDQAHCARTGASLLAAPARPRGGSGSAGRQAAVPCWVC